MLARKTFHAAGIVIVLVYRGFGLERALVAGVLGAVVALLAVLDLLRARVPKVQEVFARIFRRLLERKDERGLNTSTLYLGGCALTVALFPRDPACAGVLALALGDPLAAIVGSSVRSPRWGKVSLAGSLTCFVAATAACSLYFEWPSALLGGAAATALEAASGSKLDNLTIPLGTAIAVGL